MMMADSPVVRHDEPPPAVRALPHLRQRVIINLRRIAAPLQSVLLSFIQSLRPRWSPRASSGGYLSPSRCFSARQVVRLP